MIGPCQRPSLEDGPLVLVAIIGEPTGRWWNTGSAVLQAAWADAGLTASSLESPAVLGFAIVRAWHFITELDGPIELAMYEQCCIAEGGRRAVVGALSHQFLAPCALEEPMPLPVHHGGSPAALGERMRCLAKDRSVVVFGNDAVCAAYDSVDGVLARWIASGLIGPETLRCCLAWHLWAPLATLVVRRKWTLDMTALPVRVTRVDCWRAPVELPDHLVRLYKHWLRQVRAIPVSAPPPPPVTDKRTRYTAKDFVSFLALAQFLSSQRRLQPAVAAARAIVLDDDRAQAAPEAQIPHWRSTARARARLDVCAMIVQRQMVATEYYKYLFFDASPQGSGVEIFCCAERIIERTALDSTASGARVVDRRLPICGLGQGRTSLEDKVACLVHQLWLEYGPDASSIRGACRSVRCCLSDMGVEFGIADYPDVVDALLEDCLIGVHAPPCGPQRATGSRASSSSSGTAFLFPLALKVPGTRHIVDWVLQRAVQRCPWWAEWQAACKTLMHCLHSVRQRELLQHWLRQQCLSNKNELAATLDSGPPNFAAWRWGTLSDVVAAFLRMEPALRVVAASAGPGLFESREGAATSIHATLVSDAFADRARGLRDLMEPLFRFTHWLGRCPCPADPGHNAATCPWKGCIGPQLAARVGQAVSELGDLRARRLSSAGGSGSGDVACALDSCNMDIALSAELAMADLLAKFHWVSELPYLVWQASGPDCSGPGMQLRFGGLAGSESIESGPARSDFHWCLGCLGRVHWIDLVDCLPTKATDPGIAAKIIGDFDAAVEAGHPVHRVSEYFCGRGDHTLRGDLERHARGEGMTQLLRREIHSYMACRLDDTVSESPHRDVSGVASRARAGKMPWWSASVRLKQNLAMAADPVRERALCSAWPKWKTLLTTQEAVAPRVALKDRLFLQAVHRAGPFGLVDCSRIRALDRRDPCTEAFRANEAALPMSARLWRDLRREFARAVLSNGVVYTAMLPDSGPPDALAMSSDTVPVRSKAVAHFRVLDVAVAAKKHNHTLRWLRVRSMAMPVSLQKLSAVGPATATQCTLIPDGVPEIVDILAYLPWAAIRGNLREWSTVRPSVTTKSAVDVSDPVVVSDRQWNLTDRGAPMVVLVDTLLARGWRAVASPQRCPRSYSPASPRLVFALSRLRRQWKPLLQCLLSLDVLAEKAVVEELLAREKPGYYRALLDKLEGVEGDRALVDSGNSSAAAGVLQGSVAPLETDVPDLIDEPLRCRRGPAQLQEPVAAVAVASPTSVAADSPLRPRRDPRPVAQPPAQEAFTGLWRPEALLLQQPQEERGRSSSNSSSGSTSSSSVSPTASARPPAVAPRGARQGGMTVEGVAVTLDIHEGAAGRCGYRRLVVKCPVHPGCKKYRNTGASQTMHFGAQEPLWYVGAWVRRALESADRAEHMAYYPSLEDVRNYSETGDWSTGA